MATEYPLTSPIEVTGTGGAPGQVNFSDGTNAVEVKAPTGLVGAVDFTLPATVGTTGDFLQRTGATSTSFTNVTQHNPSGSLPLSLRFSDPSGNPTSVNSTTFAPLASVAYRGTGTDTILTLLLTVGETIGSSATAQYQIFDFTNGNVIATSAIIGPFAGGSGQIIVDYGVVSNLPAGQAIFEVLVRRGNAGGGGSAAIYSCEFYG